MDAPTNAVLLTQTCDARPGSNLVFSTLEQIGYLLPPNIKKQEKFIKKMVRDETRFHFFPQDNLFDQFKKPNRCEFQNLFLVPYDHIFKNLKRYLHARLKPDATVIFKNKIGNFFTRLAFEDAIFYSDSLVEYVIKSMKETDITNMMSALTKVGRDTSKFR